MSQENVVLARKVVSAFNRRDVPALVERTTDDFEWVTWTGLPGFPDDTHARGPAGAGLDSHPLPGA